jgi:endonuclease/exonuclease/phosphatase family metal-dependent hydrolase
MKFKFATFNVENLFDRPKVFLMEDYTKGDQVLKDIQALQTLINRKTYSAANKKKMVSLYKKVKDYAEIIESHQKLMNKNKTKVTASGRDSWLGFLKLKRRKFNDKTVKNTARVIKDVNPDVCCLVEVENRIVLDRFCGERLKWIKGGKKQQYHHNMLIDGNDRRGIDVGLVSKFEIRSVWSHIDDKKSGRTIFSRDCPEMEVTLPNGKTLWVLLNHLKSKGYGSQATSNARRKSQAAQISKLLKWYDLSKDLVIVAGDMNDTPASAPLKPLMNTKNLFDVLKTRPADDRWTYHYNKNEQIDYVLVSLPLKNVLTGAGVFRRGIHRIANHSTTGETQYPSVTSYANSASDHGCVWAEFDI